MEVRLGVVEKKPLPKTPPALSDFLRRLTQLGGDNNRATELPPTPNPSGSASAA